MVLSCRNFLKLWALMYTFLLLYILPNYKPLLWNSILYNCCKFVSFACQIHVHLCIIWKEIMYSSQIVLILCQGILVVEYSREYEKMCCFIRLALQKVLGSSGMFYPWVCLHKPSKGKIHFWCLGQEMNIYIYFFGILVLFKIIMFYFFTGFSYVCLLNLFHGIFLYLYKQACMENSYKKFLVMRIF